MSEQMECSHERNFLLPMMVCPDCLIAKDKTISELKAEVERLTKELRKVTRNRDHHLADLDQRELLIISRDLLIGELKEALKPFAELAGHLNLKPSNPETLSASDKEFAQWIVNQPYIKAKEAIEKSPSPTKASLMVEVVEAAKTMFKEAKGYDTVNTLPLRDALAKLDELEAK